MTDFYKRYKNLFSLRENQPYGNFNANRQLFNQPYAPFYSLPQREQKASSYLNVARSPALDQFQKKVLPNFGKPMPLQHFSRLKTQMVQTTLKMNQKINNSLNQKNQFYQLPKIQTKRPQIPLRQRIMTEGSQPLIKPPFFPKERRTMNTKIQQLQKQYFGRAYTNQQDRIIEKHQKQVFQQDKSRIKVNKTYDQPPQKFSRLERVKHSNSIKRWDVKVLPNSQNKKINDYSQLTPNKNEKVDSSFKLYESRQKQLFGLRENQYAFVNAKLDDIRKAQKYYPRGYINSYRQALFRRKQSKLLIQERRIKLKMLLYDQFNKSREY